MSDTSLNSIIQYGTAAARAAYVPDPAVGSQVLYFWYETDNPPDLYIWNGTAWVIINPTVAAGITQLTGDVTAGPGSGSEVATLANTAVTPATYGDATNVPQVTVDAKGRITGAVDVPITVPPASIDVDVAGALDGDGTIATPLAVRVDGVTVIINGSNELESVAAGGGITELTGDITAGPGSGSQGASIVAGVVGPVELSNSAKTKSIGITIDGGGAVLATGFKGAIRIPYAATIIGWTIMADQPGNIEFDIFLDAPGVTYPPTTSIVASTPPELTGGADDFDDSTTLTGWTTAITAGHVMGFSIVSVSAITRATLELELRLA